MLEGFCEVIGEMCGWILIPEGLGGFDVSWSEDGTVFVGHSVKAECSLCTFFFFFFFESYDYYLRYKILHAAHAMA